MYLYPYDVIRMKRRLGMPSDHFLQQHTVSAFRDNPHFPSVMLKMSDDDEKPCPFLAAPGCAVYQDRPFSCRCYPLERAVARVGDGIDRPAYYFIARHTYCMGHLEPREWTAQEWVDDQRLGPYIAMNDRWVGVDTLLRNNPWGARGNDSPALKMAFMACFNVDVFRSFVFESTFLSRFEVPAERVEKLSKSDEELLIFGFDWIKFFLAGAGPLAAKR